MLRNTTHYLVLSIKSGAPLITLTTTIQNEKKWLAETLRCGIY